MTKYPRRSVIRNCQHPLNPKRVLIVGGPGIPLEEFFLTPLQDYLRDS